MATDINRVILVGRLTKDPELRYTPNKTSVASFSIANNRSYVVQGEKKEQVSFFNCVAWSKLGEVIAQHCKKGDRIGLEGRLQQRSWQGEDGKKRYEVEVVVENFQFLSAPSASKGVEAADYSAPASDQSSYSSYSHESLPAAPFSDDEVPF